MSKPMQRQVNNIYRDHRYVPVYSLILLLLLSLSIADSGYAFYREDINDNSIENQFDSVNAMPVSGRDELGIYHNINQCKTENYFSNFLWPVLKEFVAADTINIAFPVKYDLHSVSSIDMELSNVMYANLKFKALVDAYNGLHQSAEIVEKKYTPPFLGPNLNHHPPHFTVKSIHWSRKNILAAQRTILEKANRHSPDHFNKTESLKEIKNESLAVLIGRLEMPEIKQKSLFHRPNSVSTINRGGLDVSNENPDTDKETNGSSKKEIQNHRVVDELQLPWIVRAVSSFIKYCYENKIEALIYCVILMSVVGIFSGPRSR